PMPAPRASTRAEWPREPIAEPPRPVAARDRMPAPSEADEPVAAPHAPEAAAEPAAPPERRRFFAWTRRSSGREAVKPPAELQIEPSFGHVDPGAEAAHWADHGEDREERREPPRPTPERPPTTRQPPPGREEQVEIIKSGSVDGMSYTLYSDGSIDAEFPDGKLRFASIDELRRHLEEQGS
ncbi:MAG: hypothetical protein WAL40_04190, partial [Rhodoplanes sp.]